MICYLKNVCLLSTGASACVACAPGYFSLNGSSLCITCGAGSFSSAVGSSGCSFCGLGTFLDATIVGNSQCLTCLAGSYTSMIGSSTCTLCEVGAFFDGLNASIDIISDPLHNFDGHFNGSYPFSGNGSYAPINEPRQ
jgi:hypothetical protein